MPSIFIFKMYIIWCSFFMFISNYKYVVRPGNIRDMFSDKRLSVRAVFDFVFLSGFVLL